MNPAISFHAATTPTQTSPNTYTADFNPAWTIGTVPHGGFVTAVFLRVVRLHFDTTLKKQDQPYTLTLHLEFLRRTQTGPANFVVKDVKLGRQTSVVHVTLSQDGREEVVGYVTNSNLSTEVGVSFATKWELSPPAPTADVSKFDSDNDRTWGERHSWPFSDFRKATRGIRSMFPRGGQVAQNIVDEWLCLRNGENWTQELLGSIVDTFPQVLEHYVLGFDPYSVELEKRLKPGELEKQMSNNGAKMWYPTILLNLEVKKALPVEGVKWLFVRLQAKQIKNGRFDLEIIVMDADGDLVALSHHVCFAVGSERNLAVRRKDGEAKL
nr:hypothetical protein B0A51_10341 [Rachicladosporium sp. CCFEE 5018]